MWNTNLVLFWILFSPHVWGIICIPIRSDPDVLSRPLCFRITGSKNVPTRPFSTSRNNQSYMGNLYNHTSLEMIDSALCKWILCGFCWSMGLEESQDWSTHPSHWCLLAKPVEWCTIIVGINTSKVDLVGTFNTHRLQEFVVGFGCLELVPMKEPPKPLHDQPLQFFVLTIKQF